MKKQVKEITISQAKAKTKEDLEKELKDEGFSYYTWSDPVGAYYPPHSHNHDECICVISGKITFIIQEREYELTFGKKLYLPRGTIHEAKNKGQETVSYLIGEMN